VAEWLGGLMVGWPGWLIWIVIGLLVIVGLLYIYAEATIFDTRRKHDKKQETD
jgi:hypothetical protein